MSDMRATEHLLEVLHQQAAELFGSRLADVGDEAADILAIITELRRRGDTLVRRDDLRTVVEMAFDDDALWNDEEGKTFEAAVGRLEIALGGKLR